MIAIIAVVGALLVLAALGALFTACCRPSRGPAKASPSAYPAGSYNAQAYPQGAPACGVQGSRVTLALQRPGLPAMRAHHHVQSLA